MLVKVSLDVQDFLVSKFKYSQYKSVLFRSKFKKQVNEQVVAAPPQYRVITACEVYSLPMSTQLNLCL